MINPTGVPPVNAPLLSGLRQWVELDPSNGGPPIDDPFDINDPFDEEAAEAPDGFVLDAKRPAG